ncbi:hypothetical protein [Paenibacillus sp. YPG26]|uniref:hypothetical protein n=1 Tax=Paenibacillus sp. YPG26 TaxID=2878915 RepID=UPI00203EE393|nr:hypothetical protein [Paenibacillus sp. YPG26]USB31830.1 hypothetical protein LDO05_10755 [Paenibacillus sp. YPG26]
MTRRKRKLIVGTGLLIVLVMIFFFYLTTLGGQLINNTRLEGFAARVGIPVHEESPPLPRVTSRTSPIKVTQSSYCWGKLGCADYVGGRTLLEGEKPTVVGAGERVYISYDYKPAPKVLNLHQLKDNDTPVPVLLKEGYFSAPLEKGTYYYHVSAVWASGVGDYSSGDTSSVFVIEVN